MAIRFVFFCFFLFGNVIGINAQQKPLHFSIEPQWKQQMLELEKEYVLDSLYISISELKFYLSSFKLFNNEVLVFSDSIPAYLFDMESRTTVQLKVPETVAYNEIQFQLGIDSALTVSGNVAEDLNPQKGMYWAWQSGYINFRVEGQITHQDKQKENFDFHLGGYKYPFNSAQFIKIKMNTLNQRDVKLTIDIAEVLSYFNLNQLKHLMSPGDKAVEFSKVISKKFILSKP